MALLLNLLLNLVKRVMVSPLCQQNTQVSVPKSPAIIALRPLLRDGAHSPAMVKHGMHIIQQIMVRVNPGQIPVLTVDQPLYAIAKKIQWTWPDECGERR